MGCMIGGVSLIYKKANDLVNAISYFTLFFTGAVVPLQVIPQIFSFPARVMPFYWCVESIRNSVLGQEVLILSILSFLWCKNRHPSPICTRFEHHFHALKPHLHRRSFSDTLPENQRHLIALKRHPLWHMQKLCQLSQPAELRSTFFRNRNAVLCQDVLQLSNPLALSLEFFLSCVKVFHRLTLHLVVAGSFQF